jgi:hypothetical protein
VNRRTLPAELNLNEIGMTTEIARGGLGTIREVKAGHPWAEPALVFKRFHQPARVDWAVLSQLVSWRLSLARAELNRVDRSLSWPLSVVISSDGPVGFLMRRVPPEYQIRVRLPSGRERAVLREAQYLLGTSDRARRLGIQDADLETRLELLWELAETISFLHEHGVVIGDLSSRNVLWRSAPSGVVLVDCDSMILGGVGSPHPPTTTVDWDDSAQPDMPAASADVYKYALLVLRALARTFQGRDPAAADRFLDSTAQMLLRRSLAADPGSRPSARAWEVWAAGRRAARSSGLRSQHTAVSTI